MKKYYLVIVISAFFFLGILFGMVIQQAIFQGTLIKLVSNMEGVEINIDLNESQLLEGTREIANEMVEKIKVKSDEEDKGDPSKNCTWDTTGERC